MFKVVEGSLRQAQIIDRKDILQNCALLSGVMIDSEFYSKAEVSIRLMVLLDVVEKVVREFQKELSSNRLEIFVKILRDQLLNSVRNQIYFINQNSAVAGIDSILGSRTAKFFNLQGGSYAFDAVCASGLLQIDHAIKLLRTNEKSAVVVASSTMALNPAVLDIYNQLTGGWISGASRPFDQNRSSFTLGEGAASLVLMRLDDALKENLNVLALLHSSGLSSDGTTNQMLQPSQETFKLAVDRAYCAEKTKNVDLLNDPSTLC